MRRPPTPPRALTSIKSQTHESTDNLDMGAQGFLPSGPQLGVYAYGDSARIPPYSALSRTKAIHGLILPKANLACSLKPSWWKPEQAAASFPLSSLVERWATKIESQACVFA